VLLSHFAELFTRHLFVISIEFLQYLDMQFNPQD
jgi:hypothetical protein